MIICLKLTLGFSSTRKLSLLNSAHQKNHVIQLIMRSSFAFFAIASEVFPRAVYISSIFCEIKYCLRVEGIFFLGFQESDFPLQYAREKILKYSQILHASKLGRGEIFQAGSWGLPYQKYSKTNGRVIFFFLAADKERNFKGNT